MISVLFKKKNNFLIGFEISGHAGYDTEGFDIVCAAVSSSVQMSANLITEIFSLDANIDVEENMISLLCISENDLDMADKIIRGFKLQMELISSDYPDRIRIQYLEV